MPRTQRGNTVSSSTVTFTVDTAPPTLTNVKKEPEGSVELCVIVTVEAKVTDVNSGMEGVILTLVGNLRKSRRNEG